MNYLDYNADTFKDRLRMARIASRKTVDQILAETGMTTSDWRKMHRLGRPATIKQSWLLARSLGVDTSWLLYDPDYKITFEYCE